MNTFTIDANNNITAFASLEEARAAKINHAEYFGSSQELAKLVASWPARRPIEVWNSFAGVAPFTQLKPVKRFTDRKVAVSRIWDAVQALLANVGKPAAHVAPAKGKRNQAPQKGQRRHTARTPAQNTANLAREGSKKAEVIDLMSRSQGATLAEIMELTGWQSHTVRGFVSGTLSKKLGLKVESFRSEEKERTYHEAVNQYLEQEYCDDHNRRFALDAASETDYHLPLPVKQLREIFRLETERRLGNDWAVRHNNRFYQVEGQSRNYAPAKSKVTVCEWEDGTREIHYRGRKLTHHEIEERPGKAEEVGSKRRRPFTPAAAHMPNHPWRRSYQDMKTPGSRRAGAVARISVASASAPP